jgi:hypothetical protein
MLHGRMMSMVRRTLWCSVAASDVLACLPGGSQKRRTGNLQVRCALSYTAISAFDPAGCPDTSDEAELTIVATAADIQTAHINMVTRRPLIGIIRAFIGRWGAL